MSEGIRTDDRVLEALIFCMDYAMSKVTDDEVYDKMVDLQNELREMME